ncbi:MAG TPA: MBL fold metallo-hydrolase [Woeseiaceae bacterium]|jgi:glyoxylase-like metal-dependent hydrolase (beta-lactamase superfamily II)
MPEQAARTTTLGDGITAIDTDYVRPLLDASHLIVENGRGAFVDTGVNHSVPRLVDALRQADLDPSEIDFVFLTHVHLDHAGGAGRLMRELPNAVAVVHPRGAPHMIDPARLIEGSKAVYGEAAYRRMYGEIVAIEVNRVLTAADGQVFDLAGRPLQCIYTEGHARHHYCLSDPGSAGVFTGDSFGISYRELDTINGEFIFPTTTPIHFDPPEAHKAIDRIMAEQPRQLYLTHYSRVTDLARLADDMHRRIDDFVAMAKRHANDANRTGRMHKSMFRYLFDEVREHGFAGDVDRLHAIVDTDIGLNTMGLEHWLDQQRQ